MLNLVRQMGGVAMLSVLVAIVPVFMGAAYALRPTEGKLALMRPISLASLFAGLCGLTQGLMITLRNMGDRGIPLNTPSVLIGLAESLVPLFLAFGSLTVGWLCVTAGMRRHS